MPITITFNGNSANITGLTNGQQYSFRVAAANAAGVGPFSDATTPGTPTDGAPPTGATAPGAPTLRASGPDTEGVYANILPPDSDGGSPITHYLLEWRTQYIGTFGCVEADAWSSPVTIPASSPRFELQNFMHVSKPVLAGANTIPTSTTTRPDGCVIGPKTDRGVRVRAVNAVGASNYSAILEVRPPGSRNLSGITHEQSFFKTDINAPKFDLSSIVYGNGRFVTAACSSTDGVNWTAHVGLGPNGLLASDNTSYELEFNGTHFLMCPLRASVATGERATQSNTWISANGTSWQPAGSHFNVQKVLAGTHNGQSVFALLKSIPYPSGNPSPLVAISVSANGSQWASVTLPTNCINVYVCAGRWYAHTGEGVSELWQSAPGSLSGWQKIITGRCVYRFGVRSMVSQAYGILFTPPFHIATPAGSTDAAFHNQKHYVSADNGATWSTVNTWVDGGWDAPTSLDIGDYVFTCGGIPFMTEPPYTRGSTAASDVLWTLGQSQLYPGVVGAMGNRNSRYVFPKDAPFVGLPTNRHLAIPELWQRDTMLGGGGQPPLIYAKCCAHDGNGLVVSVGGWYYGTHPDDRWPDGTLKTAVYRGVFGVHRIPLYFPSAT